MSFSIMVSQGICLIVGLVSSRMVVLFLVFKGISILSCIVAISIYIPTNSATVSIFSTSSLAYIVCKFFDDGRSDQ